MKTDDPDYQIQEDPNYIGSLGYQNRVILSWRDLDFEKTPPHIHILAEWRNGSHSVHIDVPNSVLGAFWAFDEVGDPSAVTKIWVSAEDFVIDTDQEEATDWIQYCSGIGEPIGAES